jgi:hypothetical protein
LLQKNFIALPHGIYAKPELLNWFVTEYPKHSKQKLDMGKVADLRRWTKSF